MPYNNRWGLGVDPVTMINNKISITYGGKRDLSLYDPVAAQADVVGYRKKTKKDGTEYSRDQCTECGRVGQFYYYHHEGTRVCVCGAPMGNIMVEDEVTGHGEDKDGEKGADKRRTSLVYHSKAGRARSTRETEAEKMAAAMAANIAAGASTEGTEKGEDEAASEPDMLTSMSAPGAEEADDKHPVWAIEQGLVKGNVADCGLLSGAPPPPEDVEDE